jgi:hypothetical protein
MVYFFTRLDRQFNAKPSNKDHESPGIRTRVLWSSSQHTHPLHHLGRQRERLLKYQLKDKKTGSVRGSDKVSRWLNGNELYYGIGRRKNNKISKFQLFICEIQTFL